MRVTQYLPSFDIKKFLKPKNVTDNAPSSGKWEAGFFLLLGDFPLMGALSATLIRKGKERGGHKDRLIEKIVLKIVEFKKMLETKTSPNVKLYLVLKAFLNPFSRIVES